ncbi:DNA-binding helix-turn-helix protein [[Clostridium] hylemonae DSM 15053]|uniref:DNA-binding helix-turn-helix protein n=1 Tax=[Clostridium] hylemonae DSM 15053 TaxID=553973 RepID=C0C103_9FIRM|nr:DNA-binding helix-turn-helix protein [[Clostridium] hylemonae DSM 15053]
MNIVKNLKKLRTERNLSQQQLADMLHTTQQNIYKYENGISEPNLETLKNMADHFQTSIDYLVGYTSIRHKIEPVSEYDLNSDEQTLIQKYRKLLPRIRRIVHIIIDEYLVSSGR